jgi:TolB-like protein
MYAGGAYVLIELANNVVVPLNLPDWIPRLVIIIALVGFPIMVVLSWIFDITPEGIGKTESLDELSVQEQAPSPGKRRLKVSDVIIVLLIVVVGILGYPRIFGTPRLNAMTFPVTVVNEFGEKETRRIFKEQYISRLALFPFINETKDSSLNWLGFGIMDAIIEDNLQFSNLLINWDGATHRKEQLAFAKSLNYPQFLTGAINADQGSYEITTRLYQTVDGALIAEHKYPGSDFFRLVDSICVQIRTDIDISEIVLKTTPDLSIAELMTDNLEAFGNYVLGRYHWHFDGCRYACLSRAIELDSTFAQTCYWLAYWSYNFQGSYESAVRSISQAMSYRQRLSEYNDINIRILNYLIHGELQSFIELSEWQSKLKPLDFNMLLAMLRFYWKQGLFDRVEDAALKLNELVSDHPPYQILLSGVYMYSGKPDKGIDVLNVLLMDNPENVEALLMKGEFFCINRT